MFKKHLKIILALIIILLLLFLIYFFFFRESDELLDIRDRDELFDPFGTPFPTTTFDDFTEDMFFIDDFDGESRLKQITSSPVAGFSFFTRDEEDNNEDEDKDINIIKYIERGTGHVFSTTFDNEENIRVSNITRPQIHEAFFINNGEQIIFRYLDNNDNETIITLLSDLIEMENEESEEEVSSLNQPSNTFLTNNINQIIKSVGGNIFGLISNKSRIGFNSIGFILDTEDVNNIDIILNSQISEWNAQWIGENRVALTTKTSYKSPGFSYILNINDGSLIRDLGPIQGLSTSYSPDSRFVIYSTSDGNNVDSRILNRQTNMEFRSFMGTIADKCEWSNNSSYIFCATPFFFPQGVPDLWYQGIIQFSDIIIRYNMETGNMRILSEFDSSIVPELDIINIKVSEDNNFIIFQNKNDLSLWSYDLRGVEDFVF